jgi:hypothetical protein
MTALRLPRRGEQPAEYLPFDGVGYLHDHPDVAATGLGLPHYLYYGHAEGRVLRRAQSDLYAAGQAA